MSAEYVKIQKQIKELNKGKADMKKRLFDYFDTTNGVDSKAEIDCGDGFKFAREIRETKKIDEMELKDALDPSVWKKVTISQRILDETKLRRAVANGIIDKGVIKDCVVINQTFAFTHPKSRPKEE